MRKGQAPSISRNETKEIHSLEFEQRSDRYILIVVLGKCGTTKTKQVTLLRDLESFSSILGSLREKNENKKHEAKAIKVKNEAQREKYNEAID